LAVDDDGHLQSCTSLTDHQCIGFVGNSVLQGQEIDTIITEGTISDKDWTLTANMPVYLDVNGGFIQQIDLQTIGHVKHIGMAISSTEVLIQIYPL
jgi:hypothetical protein